MENSMKNNDEIEIDLRQIFIVIMSKIAIILLVGVIFGLAAFIGSKLLFKAGVSVTDEPVCVK